jgi:hypothetical protein
MAVEASITSALCIVAALCLIAVILAPNIREGFVVRLGLSLAVLGLFGMAAQAEHGIELHRALWIVCAGTSVATTGFMLRLRKSFPAGMSQRSKHRIRP